MNVNQAPIAVEIPNVKIHDYIVNLLTNAKIDWKDANLHNEALNCMMRGVIVTPPPAQTTEQVN